MPKNLEYGAATHIGLVRSNNEDCYLAQPETGLWLIADGMGGHDAGEVASDIVKNSIAKSVNAKSDLLSAIKKSHFDVKDAVNNNIGSPNMGTTVVALLSKGAEYKVGWVGDSRAYLWRPTEQSFSQISKDHSYVQTLFDAGSITREEMDKHPQKNVITQCLGANELDVVTPDIIQGQWLKGDKVLLCSDGLTDLVSDSEIKTVFRKMHNKDNQEIVDHLVELSLEKGGVDNITIEVISAPTEGLNVIPSPFSTSNFKITAALTGVALLVLLMLLIF